MANAPRAVFIGSKEAGLESLRILHAVVDVSSNDDIWSMMARIGGQYRTVLIDI
jgi:hypothetical protein